MQRNDRQRAAAEEEKNAAEREPTEKDIVRNVSRESTQNLLFGASNNWTLKRENTAATLSLLSR